MPRRKTIKVYKFAELDPKVRAKVLDRFREHAVEPSDLTYQFKAILEERGFESEPDVCWSLSSSQGDGVAFSGHVGMDEFFKWALEGDHPAYSEQMRASGVERYLPLRGRCSVSVSKSRRECHWNSMEVEVELAVNFVDLVPKGIQEEVLHYLEIKGNLYETFEREKYVADQARQAPLREWQRRMEDWRRTKERGPKFWRPKPGPQPQRADVPEPSFAIPDAPPSVLEAIVKAEADWAALDKLVPFFKEYLEQWVKDVSRELEKLGYDEIAYRESDEQIIEMIEANDYEFTEDGRISK